MEEKTVVQSYIQNETEELIHDVDKLKEWNDFVGELGMEGQKKLVKKDKNLFKFI